MWSVPSISAAVLAQYDNRLFIDLPVQYRMSHRYWTNFLVHKQVWVPKYRSRFPSTGPILGIYLGPGSQVRVQAQYRWLIRCMKTTSSKHVVYTGLSQVFGQTVNPISTRGADYAHHSNPSPRIFRSCNSSEYINCSELSIQKQKTICVHNMFWAGSFHVLNELVIQRTIFCHIVG